MKTQYISPELKLTAFNCPHCHVCSHQSWSYFKGTISHRIGGNIQQDIKDFHVSYCSNCKGNTMWAGEIIIYPQNSTVEPANIDLPADIIEDYNEAANVLNLSPRSSAALLRLCIQKLCKHLGEIGKDINTDIKNLVAKGLPPKVQEALDSVRVIGNESVHPGELNLNDNREIANKLFKLVNFIAIKLITEPKEIDELYNSLPQSKLDGIQKRDNPL
ncbi:DUF4145 domain-containing protein [Flavobacterium sp. WLB]|uniref:DUF4145 domain-containing protein n=1 Tax=unclassified Flavobacterium TaxID=196869 RepID=UPI0006C5B6BE|nr:MULTISPECIES: DUF4145 domain-containing protein [unclassified Flavobacterium]KOP38828.1 hypothetical protein AKO67_07265 [Flavobacterium sp. VMW]PUU71947.1 DUF4145 domain-containing protein [Flavobacterium sp. WLB]